MGVQRCILLPEELYNKIKDYMDTPTVDEYVYNVMQEKMHSFMKGYHRTKVIDGYNVTNHPVSLVKEVMEDYNNGMSTVAIAEKHGMWQKTIWRIVNRNRHKITRWK